MLKASLSHRPKRLFIFISFPLIQNIQIFVNHLITLYRFNCAYIILRCIIKKISCSSHNWEKRGFPWTSSNEMYSNSENRGTFCYCAIFSFDFVLLNLSGTYYLFTFVFRLNSTTSPLLCLYFVLHVQQNRNSEVGNLKVN